MAEPYPRKIASKLDCAGWRHFAIKMRTKLPDMPKLLFGTEIPIQINEVADCAGRKNRPERPSVDFIVMLYAMDDQTRLRLHTVAFIRSLNKFTNTSRTTAIGQKDCAGLYTKQNSESIQSNRHLLQDYAPTSFYLGDGFQTICCTLV